MNRDLRVEWIWYHYECQNPKGALVFSIMFHPPFVCYNKLVLFDAGSDNGIRALRAFKLNNNSFSFAKMRFKSASYLPCCPGRSHLA